MNITELWNKERLKYQKRYADFAKQYYENKENQYILGHLHECSFVLVSIFGLSSQQVKELEKNDFCGLTNADLEKSDWRE